MGVVRAHDRNGAAQACAAARLLAVSAVRRSFHGARGCTPEPQSLPAFVMDLQAAGALFRIAQHAMVGLQGSGLIVAPPGTLATTCHERRLLRATVAAQANDGQLMDNYLAKLATHRRARPALAHAVTALGTSLATAGHWLPASKLAIPVLLVDRPHGRDLRAVGVIWPPSRVGRHVVG